MEVYCANDFDVAEQLLHNPERKTVTFAFSLHNAKCVSDGEFRLHYVIKFHYEESIIPLFGKQKPSDDELTILHMSLACRAKTSTSANSGFPG